MLLLRIAGTLRTMKTEKKDKLRRIVENVFGDTQECTQLLQLIDEVCLESYTNGLTRGAADAEWETDRVPLDFFDAKETDK